MLVSDDILALSLERIVYGSRYLHTGRICPFFPLTTHFLPDLTSPQLTSIDINSGQLGMEAATQMISHIENPSLPAHKDHCTSPADRKGQLPEDLICFQTKNRYLLC